MDSHGLPERPPDTPGVRRCLARHPEAHDLDADELDRHVFESACRHIESIRRLLKEGPS